jgi:hypothetical protein
MEMGSMGRQKRGSGGCKFVGGGVSHELGSSLYIVSRIPVSPSWAAMERAYLARPDSESGEFYVQNVCREIPYNFAIEKFSI